MFLGAMIVVPSAAWVLERFDKTVEEERTGPPDEMPNGEDKAAARLVSDSAVCERHRQDYRSIHRSSSATIAGQLAGNPSCDV